MGVLNNTYRSLEIIYFLTNLDAGKSAGKHEPANEEDGEEDVGHRGRDPDDFPRGLDAFKK